MARSRHSTVLRATSLLTGLALLLAASLTFATNPPQVRIETGIVAVSTRDGLAQIWGFHLDGSGGRALSTVPGAHYLPKVSPDGTRIAFTGEDSGGYSIGVMNIDGSAVKRQAMASISSTRACRGTDRRGGQGRP